MSRTDFEAAYIERYGHRPRGWNDDFQVYQDAHANGAWFGWQAREVVMPPSPYKPQLSDADLTDYEKGELQGRCDMWAEFARLNKGGSHE